MRKNKDAIKMSTKKAIQNFKGNNYLQTDDVETVNYNSDIEPDDLSTVNYNSDVKINDVFDAETINYNIPNKNSIAQRASKTNNKKYRNLKRKCPHLKTSKYLKNIRKNDMEDNVIFIKQVPVHPRDQLARATQKKNNIEDNVVFVKQVPVHPKDRLKKKTKTLKHPRDRLKTKELQVARDNVCAFMEGKFNFSPEQFLNKTVLSDISKVNEEKIIDRKKKIYHRIMTSCILLMNQEQMHFR